MRTENQISNQASCLIVLPCTVLVGTQNYLRRAQPCHQSQLGQTCRAPSVRTAFRRLWLLATNRLRSRLLNLSQRIGGRSAPQRQGEQDRPGRSGGVPCGLQERLGENAHLLLVFNQKNSSHDEYPPLVTLTDAKFPRSCTSFGQANARFSRGAPVV